MTLAGTPRPAPPRLDMALALRRIGLGFWLDFAPIVLLGFGMLTLPSLAAAMLVPSSAGATILAVVSGLLAALFATIVSYGVVERCRGRPLDAGAFVSRGIAASPPGYSVALLLGAVAVIGGIAVVVAGSNGAIVAAVVKLLGLLAVLRLLPALPAALFEGLGAVAALRRAVALTRGQWDRVFVVAGAVWLTGALTALAISGLVTAIGYDPAPGLASPQLWLIELCKLLAASIVAVVPGVIYAGLVGARE